MVTKQKPYRKPHVTMNRKKYGYVRPTKKEHKKILRPKPQVLDLKRIYAKLNKAASWQKLGIFAEAIQWYRSTFAYIQEVVDLKKLNYSSIAAKALKGFYASFDKMHAAVLDKEKAASAVEVLNFAQQFCIANRIKAPSVKPYLLKHKVVAKRLDSVIDRASAKYDKLLTLLMAATDSPYSFKIAPKIEQPVKLDNALKTIYLSQSEVKKMSEVLRKKGLLHLVVEYGLYVSLAQCYTKLSEGNFIPDVSKQFVLYQKLLQRFCQWATTSDAAPKNVLRKPKKV